MFKSNRRTFLKVLGGAAAASAATMPVFNALAEVPADSADEFFIFVHATGGWDVTVWADPRNTPNFTAGGQPLVEPATESNVDFELLDHWTTRADATRSFEPYRPAGSNIAWGPAIGDLAALSSRCCLINGVAMNTVNHADGKVFAWTGRHLSGGRASQPSVDTVLASQRGTSHELLPLVALNTPSFFIGGMELDPRATPLRISSVGSIATSLRRSDRFGPPEDRADVATLLAHEASTLADRSYYADSYRALAGQYGDVASMFDASLDMGDRGPLRNAFDAAWLTAQYPDIVAGRVMNPGAALGSAFAVEMIRRQKTRCMSLSFEGFDTHYDNYAQHPARLQEMFNVIAAMVNALDAIPHPNASVRGARTLGAHTHFVVMSDFCRTPQININGGRDHFPNNSTLVISNRFVNNRVFGRTDSGLLPAIDASLLGTRPIAPPDILATFLSAFEIPYSRYVRDGVIVPGLLASRP